MICYIIFFLFFLFIKISIVSSCHICKYFLKLFDIFLTKMTCIFMPKLQNCIYNTLKAYTILLHD